MKLSTALLFFLLSISVQASGFDKDNAVANFIALLKNTDSVNVQLSQQIVIKNNSDTYIDTLFRNVLNSNPQIYAVLRINHNGKILNDINRDFAANTIGNVKNKVWFKSPMKDGSVFIGGVFTANSRKCFLKTFPLINKEKKNSTYGVLACLIDLEYCLKDLPQKELSHFTLFYDKAIVFQSDPPPPFSRISIPEFGKLELMYVPSVISDPLTINYHHTTTNSIITDNQTPLTSYLPWALTFLTLAISLCFVIITKPKIKKEELVELEYQKLSEETHKLIYDRAISQLYCEIKRQVETHELNKIQNEVRQKIASDMEPKNEQYHKVMVG